MRIKRTRRVRLIAALLALFTAIAATLIAVINPAAAATGPSQRILVGGTLINADGSNPQPVGSALKGSLSPSPSGELLAGLVQPTPSGPNRVATMPLTGGGVPMVLTSDALTGTGDSLPTWSPDGSQIAFMRPVTDSTSGIWVVNSDGSNVHVISQTLDSGAVALNTTWANWSPDGKWIVYVHLNQGVRHLFIVSPITGEIRQLTSAKSDSNPVWAPGTQTIYFDRSGLTGFTEGVWRINADGTGEEQVIAPGVSTARGYLPSVSSDGYLMTSDSSTSSLFFTKLDTGEVTSLALGDQFSVAKWVPNAVAAPPTTSVLGTSTGPASTTPSTSTVSTSAPGDPAAFVALGDSYSSGEGSFDYYSDSDSPSNFDSCHRSPHAYGPLLDADRSLGPMDFGACSGAVTDDMYVANPTNPNEIAQLDRLTSNTKVVTLTIGGNDADFTHVLAKCVVGSGSDGAFGCSRNPQLRKTITNELRGLSGISSSELHVGRQIHALSSLYADIHARAPRATIYVAGYPRLFGPSYRNYQGFKSAPSGQVCTVGSTTALVHGVPISATFRVDYLDALWIDAQGIALNTVIQSQVAKAKSSAIPVVYVPPTQFNGHGLCDSQSSWLHGLDFVGAPDNPAPAPSSFHPTTVGQSSGYEAAFSRLVH